jgi:hypothetical protein
MYLGTHMPHWLGKFDVPLFVSHRRLARQKTYPRALAPWAADSGAFTEMSLYGHWVTTPAEYVAALRRYAEEIGQLSWAAPMDAMCEPHVLRKSGGTVISHQGWTVDNFVDLRMRAPELPIKPTIQGWLVPDDYLRCVDRYAAAGIDLTTYDRVGLGSVCRRQGSAEIAALVHRLAGLGLRLHGYGVKTAGLRHFAGELRSADSLSWSYRGRRVPGCSPSHKSEANCPTFALAWYERIRAMTG